MKLPEGKIKSSRVNPRKIIFYAPPKAGKTTALANLDNNLILDLEQGTDFVDAMKIQANNLTELKQVAKLIKEKNDANGGKPFYKYGTIDTGTKLEEFSLELAVDLYKAMPIGKNYKDGASGILKLPNGAGYGYAREAYKIILNQLAPLFDTLIIICHLKDKYVTKDDREVMATEIDLTGKLASLVSQEVDAIGFMYRKKGKIRVNFKSSEEVICGGRCKHLAGQDIELSETNENGEIIYHWDRIFLPEG